MKPVCMTMKGMTDVMRRTQITVLILLTSVFLTGCPLLDDDDNNSSAAEDNSDSNTEITLTVVDNDGDTLLGAIASGTDLNIVSQAYDANNRLNVEVVPSENSVVVRVSRIGYETALLALPNTQASITERVMLKERLPAIPVDVDSGGEFNGIDGAQVTVGASSFELPDGSPATGNVSLFINSVDVSDENELASFPGSFEGLASGDSQPGILASLGVTSYSFEQGGQKLQLRDGEVAQLILPLYAGTYEDGTPIPLGDLIPMWRLNEETGIWEEESTGIVVSMPSSPTGLGLQASTSHFSSFNADVWGPSSPFSPTSGPAGQSRTMPSTCIVSVQVPEFSSGTLYTARAVQNLGALASTRTLSGVYFEPFTFPVFQGRPSALNVTDVSYNEGQGRSVVQSFTCNDDTLDLVVLFDDIPAFLGTEALVEPRFEIVDGMQTITENTLSVRALFINDAEDDVEVTSSIGYTALLPTDARAQTVYLSSDESPATVAFFLENDNGTADTTETIEYIATQAPTLDAAYFYRQDGIPRLTWTGLKGADTVSVYEIDPLSPSDLGVVVESDIAATSVDGSYNLSFDLPDGLYFLIFENQYGLLEMLIELNGASDDCIPNSDLPCAA